MYSITTVGRYIILCYIMFIPPQCVALFVETVAISFCFPILHRCASGVRSRHCGASTQFAVREGCRCGTWSRFNFVVQGDFVV